MTLEGVVVGALGLLLFAIIIATGWWLRKWRDGKQVQAVEEVPVKEVPVITKVAKVAKVPEKKSKPKKKIIAWEPEFEMAKARLLLTIDSKLPTKHVHFNNKWKSIREQIIDLAPQEPLVSLLKRRQDKLEREIKEWDI